MTNKLSQELEDMYSNTLLAMAELPAPGFATDIYSALFCLANNAAQVLDDGVYRRHLIIHYQM